MRYRLRTLLKTHPRDLGYIIFFGLIGVFVGGWLGMACSESTVMRGGIPQGESVEFLIAGVLLGALAGAIVGKWLAVKDW